jgi:ZIP family zinc transporter
MEWSPVAVAFTLTFFAGLATGIGSALALLARRTNTRFLSAALGFSAGVMIYVSFVEILADARASLVAELGARPGAWVAVVAFFGGIGLTALIDRLVPAAENPHEVHRVEEMHRRPDAHLMRMGLLSAVAIALHNFPEGIATFVAALDHTRLGVGIATAVALHNIPAYLLLAGFLGNPLRGVLLAAVAGVMVFISFDELLPTAREYGEQHLAVYGLTSGMAGHGGELALVS